MFQEAADIHFMITNMQLYRPPLFVLQSFCQIVEPAAEMCSKRETKTSHVVDFPCTVSSAAYLQVKGSVCPLLLHSAFTGRMMKRPRCMYIFIQSSGHLAASPRVLLRSVRERRTSFSRVINLKYSCIVHCILCNVGVIYYHVSVFGELLAAARQEPNL